MKQYTSKIYLFILVSLGMVIMLSLVINGFDYYSTNHSNRFFHSDHEIFKPSGFIGHGLEIIGSLMMIIGISSYMIRKRVRVFIRFGALRDWLNLHIFLCSVGSILILLHTIFKFSGIASISFWSMVTVVISEIIGRMIYVQIPRSIRERKLSTTELHNKNDHTSLNF